MKQNKLKKTYNSRIHIRNLTTFFAQLVKNVQLSHFKFQDLKSRSLMTTKVSTFSYLTDQDQCMEKGLNKLFRHLFCS